MKTLDFKDFHGKLVGMEVIFEQGTTYSKHNKKTIHKIVKETKTGFRIDGYPEYLFDKNTGRRKGLSGKINMATVSECNLVIRETKEEPYIEKKSWEEFQNSGLLAFINTFLHIFGWSIVLVVDNNTHKVIGSYPARTKFRGFSSDIMSDAYKKISKYLLENANILQKESKL